MRKLATIRTIADVLPIEGADAIECVVIDGWQVVAKKGEFQTGDLCVYFEIDSVLPIREEFEFLRRGCYVKKDWLVSEANPTGEGFRLKTIKLRGQISQGLVIPVSDQFAFDADMTFEIDRPIDWCAPEEVVGFDATDVFGVVKWDPPVPANLAGKVKGNFPSFIPKTDQERIQNIKPADLAKYADDDFEVTIKLDGSSMTVYHNEGKVGVCSRNLDLDWENDPDNTFSRVFQELDMPYILPKLGNIAIQGELMGPGIQGNREGLKEHTFYVFDVYDISAGRYMSMTERWQLVAGLRAAGSEIEHCPVDCVEQAGARTPQDFLDLADGKSINHPIREGLVFKSVQNPHFSFKAISNKFLLKGGE